MCLSNPNLIDLFGWLANGYQALGLIGHFQFNSLTIYHVACKKVSVQSVYATKVYKKTFVSSRLQYFKGNHYIDSCRTILRESNGGFVFPHVFIFDKVCGLQLQFVEKGPNNIRGKRYLFQEQVEVEKLIVKVSFSILIFGKYAFTYIFFQLDPSFGIPDLTKSQSVVGVLSDQTPPTRLKT